MLSVNGIYKNGKVELLETPPNLTGSVKVVVTFVEEVSRPVSHFTEEDFWKIINLIHWEESEGKKQILPCINALTKYSPEDIMQFEEILAEKLFLLDGKDFALRIQETENFSVDDFLYIRCFAVAQGKDTYHKILENKEPLVDESFESLLYIGERAYKLLNNRDLVLNTKYSYETYSNYKAWGFTEPLPLY